MLHYLYVPIHAIGVRFEIKRHTNRGTNLGGTLSATQISLVRIKPAPSIRVRLSWSW